MRVSGVPGIDAVFVGPNDLAATMQRFDGKPPTPEASPTQQALRHPRGGEEDRKCTAGIHTFSIEEAKTRIAEEWQFIAVNSELKFMSEGAEASGGRTRPRRGCTSG